MSLYKQPWCSERHCRVCARTRVCVLSSCVFSLCLCTVVCSSSFPWHWPLDKLLQIHKSSGISATVSGRSVFRASLCLRFQTGQLRSCTAILSLGKVSVYIYSLGRSFYLTRLKSSRIQSRYRNASLSLLKQVLWDSVSTIWVTEMKNNGETLIWLLF